MERMIRRKTPGSIPCLAYNYRNNKWVRIKVYRKFNRAGIKFINSIGIRFKRRMMNGGRSWIDCRVTRPVWEAIELYYSNQGFAGLTLNQFIRQIVPKELRSPHE